MAQIYINFSEIREANYILPYIESRADFVKRRIDRIKRELPDYMCNSYQFEQRLGQVCRKVEEVEYQISQLYEIANCCVKQYEAAEYENSRNAKAFL